MKMFRIILAAVISATVLFMATGCGGDGNKTVSPEAVISVAPKLPKVDAAKGSQFINISANGAWTLTSSESWLVVSQSKGIGSTSSVYISYDENTSSASRTATLTLNCFGRLATASFTQEGKGDDPLSATASPGWLELPAIIGGEGHKFVTHKMAASGNNMRSFSYDWSKSDLVARWVAYPLNKGLAGSGSRTDAWGYDPLLTTDEQPLLMSGYKGGYDRGHQLPSADRLTAADNWKTFYFSNMTPQLNAFNTGIWASAESKVRGWAFSCDTLYVVTGCVVEGSSQKAYDNNGKSVTVPVGYYKAILRYMKESTMGYNGYMGMAMYFEHRKYSQSSINSSLTDIIMSIDDLEAKIGLDLFPNLENVAGKSVADQVEAEDPTKVQYWWR